MRMTRSGGLMIAAMFFLVQPFLSAQSAGSPFSEEAAATLRGARSAEWVALLSREIVTLHAAAPLSPAVYALVVSSVPVAALPEAPRDAARMLFDASRETDRALRRGFPRALLRAEIHLAWQTSLDSGTRFAFRVQGRAHRAAEGFGAENHGSWDPSQHGRNGQGDGLQGTSGGGPP